MAESPSAVKPPSAEHRKMAAERCERARQVITTGNLDYGIQLLLGCCALDPANLIYRQELRRAQRTKHKDGGGKGMFGFLTSAKSKVQLSSAQRAGQHLKVLEHGEQLLSKDPSDAATQLTMAESADALGLLDVGVFILDAARKDHPNNPHVNRAMARLLEKRGNYTQAMALWELVRKADPKDTEAQNKARELAASETIKRGHYEEAIQSESPMEVVRKHASESSGRIPRDAVAAQAKINEDPTEPMHYLAAAAAHRKAGKFEEALKVLHEGLGATGNDFRLQLEMAEIELEPMRQDLAITEQQWKKEPSEELHERFTAMKKEINSREIDLYRLRADRFPQDLQHRLDLGIRLLRAGQFDESIQELQAARKDERLLPRAAVHLGHAFEGRNNWRLAQRNYEEALKTLPASDEVTRKEVMFHLAKGFAENGDLTKAIDLAHELANIDYGYRDIHKLLDQWQAKA